jgi:hypothetical protein
MEHVPIPTERGMLQCRICFPTSPGCLFRGRAYALVPEGVEPAFGTASHPSRARVFSLGSMYARVSDSAYSPPGALERFDTIHDFASGSDRIDLSAVDADATHAGHQAFNLVYPTHVHSTVVGDLSALYVGEGLWNLVGETDSDAAADFFIRVHQDTAGFLLPDDFILL